MDTSESMHAQPIISFVFMEAQFFLFILICDAFVLVEIDDITEARSSRVNRQIKQNKCFRRRCQYLLY
jgi:F0F1-type ATP synthase membrane subunit b/b'